MRTYTVNLTSSQTGQYSSYPQTVDSLTFSTTGYTTVATGSSFTSITYLTAFNDGSFFPWGFALSGYTNNISLGTLKGTYTINFSTSGLDSSVFNIITVLYDFGDGQSQVISYPIGNSFYGIALINGPANTNVAHTYYPLNANGTTYTPGVTVINGNLTNYIYNISFNLIPSSIYELNEVHLLNSTSIGLSTVQSFNVFETRNPNYVTHTLLLSSTLTTAITSAPKSTYYVDYLAVAGGGSGGNVVGGGGGGGGVLSDNILISKTKSYSVIIGAGGAGAFSTTNLQGNFGGNTSLTSSSLSIQTSGGGGGGGYNHNAQNGGSGGGSGFGGSPGLGVTGQGYAGGTNSSYAGGGGGGATSKGSNASSSSAAGNGGSGCSSSITGTVSIFAAGGGGGVPSGTPGAGGSGIATLSGGTLGIPTLNAPANTGHGTGGTRISYVTTPGIYTGNGGSGTVIVSFATTDYPGDNNINNGIGNGTVWTKTITSNNTVITFLQSATFVA